MTRDCGASSSSSPPGSARLGLLSGTKSCTASCALPAAQALTDPLRLFQQLPVVRPRRARDSDSELRLEVVACRSHCVLLRVAPAIPRPLDCRLDHLLPVGVAFSGGRGGQRQHLPHLFGAAPAPL